MSDSPAERSSEESTEQAAPLKALRLVQRVLNRDDPISALSELRRGVAPDKQARVDSSLPFAIGFDTNAIFRLGIGARGPDAVDYLVSAHKGPVIVPGQTIQEVWNNSLSAVLPQAKVVRKKLEELEVEMQKVDQHLGSEGAAVREAISDLVTTRGDWMDPASLSTFETTLDSLLKAGETSYVPREQFAALARIRKDTKTPPGFEDPGLGDFFVWADFLFGLARETRPFAGAVLVTNDTKKDWSRNGVAHPILVAEAEAVAKVPFALWTLPQLWDFSSSVITAAAPDATST